MKTIAVNKKAKFLYFLGDEYIAGVELKGSEVKAIREGGISLDGSYVTISSAGEVFLLNTFVKEYKNASFKVDERRTRKLLLNRQEINKLIKFVKLKGGTIVPTKVFISDKGLVKVCIAEAKGKKIYDKNQSSKDASREKSAKMEFKNMNIKFA